jgi:hypothetical protein
MAVARLYWLHNLFEASLIYKEHRRDLCNVKRPEMWE